MLWSMLLCWFQILLQPINMDSDLLVNRDRLWQNTINKYEIHYHAETAELIEMLGPAYLPRAAEYFLEWYASAQPDYQLIQACIPPLTSAE